MRSKEDQTLIDLLICTVMECNAWADGGAKAALGLSDAQKLAHIVEITGRTRAYLHQSAQPINSEAR